MLLADLQTSRLHHKFSHVPWVLDMNSIFAQVEAFIQRCRDLCDVSLGLFCVNLVNIFLLSREYHSIWKQ